MRPSRFQASDLNRRTRQLASRERVGRFARGRVWEHIESFVRRKWKILLVLFFLPLVSAMPLFLITKGPERWIFVGAFGISGPWAVLTLTILWSGSANSIMGLDGESATADVLRRLWRDGWMLVNGIKVQRNSDIDHVMIGPAGLLVIESKWSSNQWPMSDQKQTFMSNQLANAVSQVLKNRADIKAQFTRVLEGVPAQAVCVLWSGEDSSDDPPWVERNGVIIVRGPALGLWLKSLTEVVLDKPKIEQVWTEIGQYALQRDDYDIEHFGKPHPTFDRLVMRKIVWPILEVIAGSMAALYGLMGLAHFHRSWLIGWILVFIAMGLGTLHISVLRKVALGWLGSSIAMGLVVLGFVIRTYIA